MSNEVKRFKLIWRDGAYYVSEPCIDTCEVVLASAYDSLQAERDRLLEALYKSAAFIARMYESGCDCDCEPEGHHCGWPALRKAHEENQRALASVRS